MKSVSEAFDSFAHALRLNTEQLIRAPYLMCIDPQECAGNLDHSLTGLLNAFHSIYDASSENSAVSFAWNDVAATSSILAIRNARHHNVASRIRSLETYFTRPGTVPAHRSYQLISFGPEPDADIPAFVQALSWNDIRTLLLLPRTQNHLSANRVATIHGYLNSERISQIVFEQSSDLPIFFDVLPLIVNAGAAAVSAIGALIEPLSVESRTFLRHFAEISPIDISVVRHQLLTFRA